MREGRNLRVRVLLITQVAPSKFRGGAWPDPEKSFHFALAIFRPPSREGRFFNLLRPCASDASAPSPRRSRGEAAAVPTRRGSVRLHRRLRGSRDPLKP